MITLLLVFVLCVGVFAWWRRYLRKYNEYMQKWDEYMMNALRYYRDIE